ncbi:MAG: MFS transporter [Gammaproteobacteria bacterium]|nr:MFS transporter [Gammaproteobacteria bacterium]MBT8109453.1 MFS transporter [Gammaproteobacteria bacterium]NND46409.1 MFS transporter [Woeseiaceae bacterium]NNL44155.1 MFS transporter [Woeseiaceae bacterium]
MYRIMLMATLVFAGEIIFGLPFHTARFFRPTLLEAFEFTNTQLGDVFAVYGVTAMIAYFPGGMLADRFSARALLTTSLVATGAGGFYMATYPGTMGMALLYGYWGVTTILLFWAALIRATREWGGVTSQGRAFGILEGGRGVAAALFATMAVAVLAGILPENANVISNEERRVAFRAVILLYSFAAIATALLTWFLIPAVKHVGDSSQSLFHGAAVVVTRPLVWAQAAVIICAYCCYKGLDNYSLYAVQVLGMNEVEGAQLSAYGAYVRPFAAVAAGLLADRWSASKTIGSSFIVLLFAYAMLSFALPDGPGLAVIYANIFVSFFAVFALRGVYFALLEENRTPAYFTGAVTGMVSFVGYTPEIFFAPITGRILDASPGIVGHQNYFLFLTAVAVIGILVVAGLLRLQRSNSHVSWPNDAARDMKSVTK